MEYCLSSKNQMRKGKIKQKMNWIDEITDRFENNRNKLAKIEGRKEAIEGNIKTNKIKLEESQELMLECELTIKLLEIVGQTGRAKIKNEIETLTTHALSSTFEDDLYEFVVEFVNRRKQIECDLLLSTQGRVGNPKDSSGGGVVDVITTALRFVILTILNQEGPCLLDEPGKFVSDSSQINFMLFIKEFSEQTKRQIIMSTHINKYIYAIPDSNKIMIEKDSGKSTAKTVVNT